jgi:hypothetical protein
MIPVLILNAKWFSCDSRPAIDILPEVVAEVRAAGSSVCAAVDDRLLGSHPHLHLHG